MARFIPAWEEDQDKRIQPRDVAGYRQKVGDGWDFFVTTTAWKEEVCRGLDARRVAAILEQKGGLLCDTKTHRTNVCRVPGHGRLRLDVMGLLLLLQGGEVTALTAESASTRRSSGAVLRFRRPAPGGVLLSEAAHV